MDAKSYCDSVKIELTQWKAKLYDVIRKTESLSADHKDKVGPTVDELNAIEKTGLVLASAVAYS